LHRFGRALATGGLGLSLLAGDVAAAATCFTLQAELTHLQSQGGSSRDRARYERAYREQIEVIARTEARARDAGCFGGGFAFFQEEPAAACEMLVPKLREMEVNLGRLDRLRMTGDDGDTERIREIEGMMADRGCGTPDADQWAAGADDEWAYDLDQTYSAAGAFRTVCVRTCDGYFFPISYSTTSEQFPTDARTCSSMCPGAETNLYYYPNPGGSPQEMISMDGANYSDLPSAFLYRTRVQPACACGAHGASSSITAALEGTRELSPTARLPRPRAAPGEDPETLANRAGNFVPRVASQDTMASVDIIVTEDGRTIRVVGPVFGASQEQQEAILTPVPN